MYEYHGSSEHARRLGLQTCRCQSGGHSFDIEELLEGNLIRDPRDLSLPLTSDEIGIGPRREFMFIYAVSVRHEFRLAPDGDRNNPGATKHETLFQNANVLAAGELKVTEGIIVDINDASGSYGTRGVMEHDLQFSSDILKSIERNQIPIGILALAKLRAFGESS